MLQLLFLGTGSSTGVPVVTCKCSVCLSTDLHNKRLRPSVLLRVEGKKILIDAGPDFRQQALRYGIDDLDALMLTHSHFDHIAGLDDFRVFYFLKKKRLPCLLSKESLQDIQTHFYYFAAQNRFEYTVLENDFGVVDFLGKPWTYVSYVQNTMKVTGFRLGTFAYVLDIKDYTPQVIDALKGVETLVLSALRETASPAHLTLDEAVAFSERVGAKTTWLSHIAHEIDHEETNHKLPKHIQLAYDGLHLTLHS